MSLKKENNIVEEKDIDINDELDISEAEDNEEVSSKIGKAQKFLEKLLLISAFISICYTIYANFLVFNPDERELSDDNLFSGNDLVISGEQLDDLVNDLEEELGVVIDSEEIEEYALLNAICDNDNLTDREKNVCYKMIDLIKDNPYIDKEKAYRSLRNVDISYKFRPSVYDKNVTGVYIEDCASIGIFKLDKDNSTLYHELIHCIFSNENTEKLPQYFREGMTELLANEYFSETPFLEHKSYPFEKAAVKMLCEVTSPEIVLEAFSTGNMDIIAQEMSLITQDIEEARYALTSLENIFLRSKYRKNVKIPFSTLSDNSLGVFRGIVNFKYPEGYIDRESYYYNELAFSNIFYDFAYDGFRDALQEQGDPYTDYAAYLEEFGIKEKAYFSSDLIEQTNEKITAAKVLQMVN